MSYSDIINVRPEVLKGTLEGIIDIQNLLDGQTGTIETNADLFFEMTFPTSDIHLVVEKLNQRFAKPENSAGLLLLEGYKGSGKSHLALLIYHLLANQSIAQKWLARFNLALQVPDDIKVHVFKFTDSPIHTSLWDIIFKKIGTTGHRLDNSPSLAQWREVLKQRRIVLIFDELERGMASLPPAIQQQNLSFLQMISEEARRNKEAACTIVASIYDAQREPGSTLQRIHPVEIKFSHPDDRQNIVLHRLFTKLPQDQRNKIEMVIHSFANFWRSQQIRVDEKYIERALSTFPFSPELMDLVLYHIPARGGFQGNRSALGFLGALVKQTWGKTQWITMADASLTNTSIRNRISDLDSSQRIMQCAQSDLNDLRELALCGEIISSALLGSLAHSGHLPGLDEQEMARQVLTPGEDINRYHGSLQALLKLGTYFQMHEHKYYFDEREKPGAKVEYHSLRIDPDKAIEFAFGRWKEELFCYPKAVIHREMTRTRSELTGLDARDLRFVLSPKRLDDPIRHAILQGMENQNRIILLEPKQESFNIFEQPDILKWAQRALAARDLAMTTTETERKREYEKIEREEIKYIVQAIRQAGLLFICSQLSDERTGIIRFELETLPNAEKMEEVKHVLQTQLFPRQIFEEHLQRHLSGLLGKSVRQIEGIYYKTLGFPMLISRSMLYEAVTNLCFQKKIGLQHTRDTACGRRPDLRGDELLDATIVEPFEDRKCSPIDKATTSGEFLSPSEPIDEPETTSERQQIEQDFQSRSKIQTPFTNSLGQLRQEVAGRLLNHADKQIADLEFRIFAEYRAIDLGQYAQALRGVMSGTGDLSLDVVIRKQGPFSKAQIEQLVEALPVYQGATYKAEMSVIDQGNG